jgi:GT2 family glycosyltransferase
VVKVLLIMMNLNGERWLADCISASTAAKICTEALMPDVQVDPYLIDVGSTDRSLEIAQRCKEKGAQFTLYQTGMCWQSTAINRLMKDIDALNQYDYWFYIANDDMILPFMISTHLREMAKDPELMLTHGRVIMWMEEQRNLYMPVLSNWHDKFTVEKKNGICQPSVCLRMEALRRWGLPDEGMRYCWDYELWARVLKNGGKIKWIDCEPLAYYRFRRDNGTTLHLQDMIKENAVIVERWLK